MSGAGNCSDLDSFIDGELGKNEARAFRDHLGVCPQCPDRLRATMLADDLVEVATAGTRACTVEVEAQDDQQTVRQPVPPSPGRARAQLPLDQLARHRWRRIRFASVLVGGTVAAAAAVLVVWGTTRPPDLLAALGEETHRSIDGRLIYPGLDRHRPLARERGGLGVGVARINREQVLSDLESREDHHGLAVALLLEGRAEQADSRLANSSSTSATQSDASAIALERGDAETALARANLALRLDPRRPQALWNRAVALEMLGRKEEAVRAFLEVAALGEEGWAKEASERAARLRASPLPRGRTR